MTYYFKIIFDAINEWHSSNVLDKLKITIINGFKNLYFILNNLNYGFAADADMRNLSLRVIEIIPTILLNRNNDDLSHYLIILILIYQLFHLVLQDLTQQI